MEKPDSALSRVHLQWFGDAAGTPEAKAEQKAGDQTGSGEPAAPEGAKVTVTAEDYAKLKSQYDHMLAVFKEKEGRERKQQEDALKKKGEFEKLYNEAMAELEALRPKAERMSGVIQTLLEAELQGMPKEFDRTLLPGGDPDVQLDWIGKAKKSGLLKAAQQAAKPGDGTPPQAGKADEGFMGIYSKQR